jgi:hypothetical protein
MTSYQSFVLVDDRELSAADLRHAYHSYAPVFEAVANECLTASWDGPNTLVIACGDSSITPARINVQKSQIDGVLIKYKGIPLK